MQTLHGMPYYTVLNISCPSRNDFIQATSVSLGYLRWGVFLISFLSETNILLSSISVHDSQHSYLHKATCIYTIKPTENAYCFCNILFVLSDKNQLLNLINNF